MMRFILTFYILCLFFAKHTFAIQNIDYCRMEGNKFSVYFAPQSGANDNEINNLASGLKNVSLELEVGDRLDIFLATSEGINLVFSECLPGCPPQGIMSQFIGLGGSCKPTLAKRDLKLFYEKFKITGRQIMQNSMQSERQNHPILEILSSITSHLENDEDFNNKKVFLISSMNDGVLISDNKYDEFFISSVQNSNIPLKFPELEITGFNLNAKLIELWSDIYLLNNQIFKYK